MTQVKSPEDIALSQVEAPVEPEAPEVAAARESLQRLLDGFNGLYGFWGDAHKMGANIGQYYDPETGKKRFVILDVSPLVTAPPAPEAVKAAEVKLEAAQPENLSVTQEGVSSEQG